MDAYLKFILRSNTCLELTWLQSVYRRVYSELKMYWRGIMLAAIGAGSLSGAMVGWSVDTAMTPPPDSPWQDQFDQVPSTNDTYQFVEAGPQDLNPFSDRPAWTRNRNLNAQSYEPASITPGSSYNHHAELTLHSEINEISPDSEHGQMYSEHISVVKEADYRSTAESFPTKDDYQHSTGAISSDIGQYSILNSTS
ncbi:MAG: hypothetical protein EOP09_01600 [Proteobacteria bacterium]|nr:MAG: hypothetical protein EOP09_01600 [Pseudomonadota bacterium]